MTSWIMFCFSFFVLLQQRRIQVCADLCIRCSIGALVVFLKCPARILQRLWLFLDSQSCHMDMSFYVLFKSLVLMQCCYLFPRKACCFRFSDKLFESLSFEIDLWVVSMVPLLFVNVVLLSFVPASFFKHYYMKIVV